MVASYAYDTLGRLTALTHRTSAQTIIDGFTYTHDNVGNRLTMADATGLHGYQYDWIYQLTRATHPNLTEAYTYDRTGNRVTETRGQGTVNYTTASDNRIQTRGSESYAHDQNGNMISRTDSNGTTTYEYDYENRLKKAMLPNGTVAEYRYDPFGRRVEKKVNGVVTRYLYDKEDIIAEYDGGVNLAARYVHGPGIDEPLSIEKGGGIYYYHTDGLGSAAALTDATGNKVQSYGYDAYGNLTSQTGTLSQPYTYTGREYDPETGLYYYRARYYDAEAGRFISKDPIGFKGGDVNVYNYTSGNPVNWVDPFGLDRLRFNKHTLFWLDDNGKVITSYDAISGPYGRGSLPNGDYIGSNLRNRTDNNGMMCGDSGWSLDLTPQFETDRSLLRIHPDGGVLGTLGCIGVSCRSQRELYIRLQKYLENNPNIPVEVRY